MHTPPPTTNPADDEWRKRQPIWHRLNPCDIARYNALAPVGDFLARLSSGCPCCDTVRVIVGTIVGIVIGAVLF